jgi:hypothetical protein
MCPWDVDARVLRIANRVLIEGQDADTLVEGEEITLTRWGNIKVRLPSA